MAVKFAGLISGALAAAIKQLVLAGLPTTHVLMFLFACLFMALPTAEKMAPLSCGAMSKRKETNKDAGKLRMHEYEKIEQMKCANLEQIAALHTGSTRLRPDKASEIGTVESNLRWRLSDGIDVISDNTIRARAEKLVAAHLQFVSLDHLSEKRESAIVQLHDAPAEGFHGALTRRHQMQRDDDCKFGMTYDLKNSREVPTA
jgi:hypothetical protein